MKHWNHFEANETATMAAICTSPGVGSRLRIPDHDVHVMADLLNVECRKLRPTTSRVKAAISKELNMYSSVARSCVASRVEIRDCLVHIGRAFDAHFSSDIISLMKVSLLTNP